MLQGDRVSLDLICKSQSKLLLESQGNQHIYRRQDDQKPCLQEIEGIVEEQARVIICPQPTVMHEDGDFVQTQRWDIHPSANVILLDAFHAGRSENGERFRYRRFQSDVHLCRGRDAFFVDRFLSEPREYQHFSASVFGEFAYMLNIFSHGPIAHATHHQLIDQRLSSEQLKISELPQRPFRGLESFSSYQMDEESGVLYSRSLALHRHQLESITEQLIALSSDFFEAPCSLSRS